MARPSNFSWTYPKVSGQNFNITATEWNSFTNRINEFLTYKGLSTYSFTSVSSGMDFAAVIFNQGRNKISEMISTSVPSVSSGNTLYASYFNQLVSDLNSIYIIYTMTVYIPSTGDSTSQSQSKIVSIPNLRSVTSCTVNTGSVSYSINGTDITINTNSGSPVRSYTPSGTANTSRDTVVGGDPATLPSSVYYDYGGYTGYLYPGTAYVLSGSPAGSQECTGTWSSTFNVVNGVSDTQWPNSIYYYDGTYEGWIEIYEPSASTIDNWNAYTYATANGTSWSGVLSFDYNSTLFKPDTRVWRKDYSGTVYAATTYYYAYVVTLTYTTS